MNLPNALTVLRIFLVPVLVVVLLTRARTDEGLMLGMGIFGLAVLTDYFDGYFARRRNQVTKLGILLDPIADKLLTAAAFLSFGSRTCRRRSPSSSCCARAIPPPPARAVPAPNTLWLGSSSHRLRGRLLLELYREVYRTSPRPEPPAKPCRPRPWPPRPPEGPRRRPSAAAIKAAGSAPRRTGGRPRRTACRRA